MQHCGLIHALPPSSRRGYDRKEAASYVGVSPTSFDKLVNSGRMPQANQFLGRKVWDVRHLDRVLDTLSGIDSRHQAGAHDDEDSLDDELAAFGVKNGYA